ncbi:GMC oxidoreductase [Mycobacterium kubicae]|uniref:GMC oxidoreductase n=1 Tax=Mycobacterium kubicae TaxID=120959 RepID=UPI0021B20F0C|nr:GMC family oxidoreductase [Mycobacterium kubicae]
MDHEGLLFVVGAVVAAPLHDRRPSPINDRYSVSSHLNQRPWALQLAGSAADQPPIVDPNYLSDARDMDTLITGLRIARDIAAAASLKPWYGQEIAPGPKADDDQSLRMYIRQTLSSYFHPAGTCAMGETEQSVTDTQLRVHGITGLRIVDASVMPSLPSNNPLATVYGIAEQAAELIRHSTTPNG